MLEGNTPNKAGEFLPPGILSGGVDCAPSGSPAEEWSYIRNTILIYCFRWPKPGAYSGHGAWFIIQSLLYPNAVYNKDEEMVVQFKALRDIAADEITVNYNREPQDRSPVWFEVLS